jgi:hypothetical protein
MGYWFWDSMRTEPFDSQVWKHSQKRRHYMYYSVEKQIIGKKKAEALTLLGPPDETNQGNWHYSMPSHNGEYWILILVFDKENKVVVADEDRS